jgi:hypothetical protein
MDEVVTHNPLTLEALRAAFDGSYPTTLPAALYDRAKAEGFNLTGYLRTAADAHEQIGASFDD